MTTVDYQGAIKILRKVEEDDRNWRGGLSQIGQLLGAAMNADAQLRGADERLQDLNQAIKSAESRAQEAGRTAASAETRAQEAVAASKSMETALAEKRALLTKLGSVEALDGHIAERTEKLRRLNQEIEKLRAQLA